MKKLIILFFLILIVVITIVYVKERKQLVGGPCSYKETKGICRIATVEKTKESIVQVNLAGGPGYEGNLVKFNFLSGKKESDTNFLNKKEYVLKLTNSWYPGDKFIKKYEIQEGRNFNCIKREIIKGTCTPVLFDFPAIDSSDYFETKK